MSIIHTTHSHVSIHLRLPGFRLLLPLLGLRLGLRTHSAKHVDLAVGIDNRVLLHDVQGSAGAPCRPVHGLLGEVVSGRAAWLVSIRSTL